jgi:hypothetical protein
VRVLYFTEGAVVVDDPAQAALYELRRALWRAVGAAGVAEARAEIDETWQAMADAEAERNER